MLDAWSIGLLRPIGYKPCQLCSYMGQELCHRIGADEDVTIASRLVGVLLWMAEWYGNDYDKAFEVVMAGKAHTFDSFACAI